MDVFQTERLIIRRYTPEDADAVYEIYRDPEVKEFIGGGAESREESRASLAWLIERSQEWEGLGSWAIEERDTGRVVGTLILKPLPGHDDIEVGWHLARWAWGRGYATEAARAALLYGFDTLGLPRIVAVVNPRNERSLAVAQRLEMRHAGRIRAYDQEVEFFIRERP